MAFPAKDGSKHTNRDSMQRADAKHMAKAPSPPMDDHEDGEPGDTDGAYTPNDGAAMAQQHGPAVEVNVSHQGGRHSVHAVHPDGHSHETEHGSAQEAHKYAGDCAGAGGGM